MCWIAPCVLFVIVALGIEVPAGFASPPNYTEKDYAAYQLFTGCKPIKVNVKVTSNEARHRGISEAYLRQLMVNQLREAHILTDDTEIKNVSLMAQLHLDDLGLVTVLRIEFWKTLFDPISQRAGYSSTWGATGLIMADENNEFVHMKISLLIEKFIAEFHRVNAAACER